MRAPVFAIPSRRKHNLASRKVLAGKLWRTCSL
jgi:hypothetical protein